MTPNEPPVSMAGRSSGLSRRTLVKGAVWTAPALAVAVAAPAYAASTCAGSGSKTFRAPTAYEPDSVTFTVPDGITTLQYVVAGGAGGLEVGDANPVPGGQGAKITGTLDVTPGEVLRIYAAQGGTGNNSLQTSTSGRTPGGRGYGYGGSAGSPSPDYSPSNTVWARGGGGGGASAIVRGTTALVVAGGGGGSGGASSSSNGSIAEVYNRYGGNAGQDGTRGHNEATSSLGQYWSFDTAPGRGGNAGGLGGNWRSSSGSFNAGPLFKAGGNGTASTSSAGGKGGDSTGASVSTGIGSRGAAGGGGGGGYQGGGAGESASAAYTSMSIAASGGGGGGGSSYIASGVTGSIGLTGVSGTTVTPVDGYVTLSWVC